MTYNNYRVNKKINDFIIELEKQHLLTHYEDHLLIHPSTGEIVRQCATIEYKTHYGIINIIAINNVYDMKEVKRCIKIYKRWKKNDFSGEFYDYYKK